MRAKLDGVRVLDVSRVLAGPYCSMILGDLGADVIKVEPPGGDETRTWPPFYSNGESGYYLALNRNKRGIVLNLKNHSGKQVIYDLCEKSDIFIENFTPGVVDRLGIDYETLSKINPNIIYCSISGFGQTGSYRNKRAYDPVIQAMGGAMSVTGIKDGDPVKIGIPVGDLGGSMMAIVSILAALYCREKTEIGDYIDISMYDGQIALLSIMAAQYFVNGEEPGRWGLEHPWRVPSKTFKTKDGYITSSATSSSMYPKLCKILGLNHLIEDPRFKTNELRVLNRKLLYPEIDSKMMEKTSKEWEKIFEEAGLPNGILKNLHEVFTDEHTIKREMVTTMVHPTLGEIRTIGIPFKFANGDVNITKAPPMLGQHIDEVMRDILEYGEEKIEKLKKKKTFG
jgi:formyl-CoA transferase/CoA:oxalate CoA-transferase